MNSQDRTCSVTLNEVGHWFPGTDVLFHGVTAELRTGTMTGVCGPSGCGKSTLLMLIAGWERPQLGSIIRSGVGSMSWVFQNPVGVARRTAVDHVAFPFVVRGMARREASAAAMELMRQFDLVGVADRQFSALSGGEAQRLMLARALATDPDVLLVDEPTAQLDRRSAVPINRTLARLATRGAIVIVATHDPETRAVCEGVIDLASGSERPVRVASTASASVATGAP